MQRSYAAALKTAEADKHAGQSSYKRTTSGWGSMKTDLKNSHTVYGKNARNDSRTYQAGSPPPHPWHFALHLARRELGDGRLPEEYSRAASQNKAQIMAEYNRRWPNAVRRDGHVLTMDHMTKHMVRVAIKMFNYKGSSFPRKSVKFSSDIYTMLRRMDMNTAQTTLQTILQKMVVPALEAGAKGVVITLESYQRFLNAKRKGYPYVHKNEINRAPMKAVRTQKKAQRESMIASGINPKTGKPKSAKRVAQGKRLAEQNKARKAGKKTSGSSSSSDAMQL